MSDIIHTLLDGNRSIEMLEWCQEHITPDTWHVEQLEYIQVSPYTPRLLIWRWSFNLHADKCKFVHRWPCVYQINVVYYDSGDRNTNKVYKSDTWDTPDEWKSWATQVGMPFETHRVQSQGPWLGTMGDPISPKFDVRYLRFTSCEDATQFITTWGTP